MLERTWAAVRRTVRSMPSGSGGERRGAGHAQLKPDASRDPQGHGMPVGHVSRVFREVYEAERLSAGAIPLARNPESLRALADRVILQLHDSAQARVLEMENTVDQDLVAPCDPERIVKVLLHLVFNAISASRRGGCVRIDARAIENRIIVSVHDDGAGIDPRAWPYLFREGWRDPSRKGEGLGLSVSKAIVRAHGGKIWCESSIGRGTTLRFTLPIAREPSDPEQKSENQ